MNLTCSLRWQARQDILEIGIWIMPIEFGTLDQTHHRSTTLGPHAVNPRTASCFCYRNVSITEIIQGSRLWKVCAQPAEEAICTWEQCAVPSTCVTGVSTFHNLRYFPHAVQLLRGGSSCLRPHVPDLAGHATGNGFQRSVSEQTITFTIWKNEVMLKELSSATAAALPILPFGLRANEVIASR